MKIFSKISFFIIFCGSLFWSCEAVDLNGLKNEYEVSPELIDPVYGFNFIQVSLAAFIDDVNDITMPLTRQYAMVGGRTYDNAFQPVNSNTNWRRAYTILNTIKIFEPKALDQKQFSLLGASKIIRAYVLFTLVDLYGDVPYSEAFLGNENLNPKFDKSEEVYKVALAELDSAINLLNQSSANDSGEPYDLYYGSANNLKKINVGNWKTLANTLKFRALVTARKNGTALGVNINSEITSLLTQNLIDTPSEDFAFKYSTDNFTIPNTSRHPLFNNSYVTGNSPSYISNYILWTLVREKSTSVTSNTDNNLIDPRAPYYFYNQTANARDLGVDILTNKLSPRPEHFDTSKYSSFFNPARLSPFVLINPTLLPSGDKTMPYFGSDHGASGGRPQDATFVTLMGVYPGGGKFGSPVSSQSVSGSAGQQGAGIMPIIMSSYVSFLKAEVYLTISNDSNNAKIELLKGVNFSINKATGLFPNLPQPTSASITTYNNYVGNYFDAFPSKQLELVLKEFYIASWGNGIETYNNYRRTGFPSNFQPTVDFNESSYFSCLYYPSDSQVANSNKPANLRTRKTFWDVNSPILH